MAKLLTFFAICLLSINGYTQTSECSKAVEDAHLMCQTAQITCTNLKDCLIRRDTCVDREPQSKEECVKLNDCMQANKHRFPDNHRCDYTWLESTTAKFCNVKSHFLFTEEGCPGRIQGIFNALAFGFSATVDNEFTCEANVFKFEKKAKTCAEYLAEAKSACKIEPKSLNAYKNLTCVAAKNFASYKNREFALDPIHSTSVNDSKRSQKESTQDFDSSSKSGNSSVR